VDRCVGQTAEELKQGYEAFKGEKYDKELAAIAHTHGLQTTDHKSNDF